MRKFVIL